jgi:putative hemolysin
MTLTVSGVTVAVAASAETRKPVAIAGGKPDPSVTVGIANPAAVFCIRSGGIHSIRKAADGSEYGVCVFPDGTVIDAWEYFRTHAPKN